MPQSNRDWHELVERAQLGGLVRELAQHCEWVSSEDCQLKLRLPNEHRHLTAMPGTQPKLQDALRQLLGESLRLGIEIGEVSSQTPAQRKDEIRRERHAEAVASMEADPFVQKLVERFDATLVESSVKPLQEKEA